MNFFVQEDFTKLKVALGFWDYFARGYPSGIFFGPRFLGAPLRAKLKIGQRSCGLESNKLSRHGAGSDGTGWSRLCGSICLKLLGMILGGRRGRLAQTASDLEQGLQRYEVLKFSMGPGAAF